LAEHILFHSFANPLITSSQFVLHSYTR